ncbi:HNH endonuclease [Cytobacillus massiliigabonensis]|uniref:HNH endonuclease n=1 Tax=Cytobacillus massiliigabonensis TaxID=1871011 RepID=UPI000C816673|nr:HNH endonuclease [Cytobacillus massiliigabonensis]
MGFFQYTGELFGQASTAFIGKPVQFLGNKVNSHFITDIGNTIEHAGESSWKILGAAGDGVSDTLTGTLTRDSEKTNHGVQILKEVIEQTGSGIESAVTNTAENVRDVYEGIVHKDYDKLKSGSKEVLKLIIVGGVTVGIVDVLNGPTVVGAENQIDSYDDSDQFINSNEKTETQPSTGMETISANDEYVLQTINSELDGEEHTETNVPFEKSTIELANGDTVTGVFPDFEEVTAVTIPEDLYLESDYMQFEAANSVLAQKVENIPELRSQFTPMQLEQISQGETPDGYVWHHHETLGRLELVDESIHASTGHTGGRFIWGGGSEYR